MKYLNRCARDFIHDTLVGGKDLWDAVEKEEAIHYVITHPNGWEGFQQQQLRDAAVMAGLVKGDEGNAPRITFLSEGEASLHFATWKGLLDGAVDVSICVVSLNWR